MIEIKEEQERRTRALLIGAPEDDLSELKGLADTLGMEQAQALTLTRLEVQPAYGMGKGKAAELADLAKEIQADCIIFDFQIDPTKQRNWEKLAGIPVFDREEVILRIFARRAQTHEAVLQVELARLQYSLPRLAHSYGDMARQRGGSYGAKGSGETQLELDQRQVRERIYQTKQELKTVASGRGTQRKRRERIPLSTCALVGYTNAGKSSLLNALTGADVFVENKLFATLDPTTRRLPLKEGGSLLLTDTVGFISNLPHTLVDAFKSTLEEAAKADLLLLVIDAADPNAETQYKTVCTVLEEIGAGKKPRIILLNKTDKLDSDGVRLAQLKVTFPGALCVSAKEKTGFGELAALMSEMLLGEKRDYVLPVSEKALLDEIRRSGLILDEKWMDDGIHVTARTSGKPLALITPYLVQ
ncbi:MAG TPA: GTPase HflX [Treponema sp.]|nr:GTPase HflX [Treponema sp.]